MLWHTSLNWCSKSWHRAPKTPWNILCRGVSFVMLMRWLLKAPQDRAGCLCHQPSNFRASTWSPAPDLRRGRGAGAEYNHQLFNQQCLSVRATKKPKKGVQRASRLNRWIFREGAHQRAGKLPASHMSPVYFFILLLIGSETGGKGTTFKTMTQPEDTT